MHVIARCEGCGHEYLVRPDRTVSLECDCPLRDPDTPWSVTEYVPAEQARGAVELLEQAVSLIAQPTIPAHARKRWQAAVDELLGDGTATGGQSGERGAQEPVS